MTGLTLLRHGETDWSRDGRFQGLADVPLTAEGRRQAERAAGRLRDSGVVRVFSSDLARARVTAGIVADRLGVPVELDPRLREVDVGSWEGLTRAEVGERHPHEYAAWRADPTLAVCGREQWAALMGRCRSALEAILAGYEGREVLVVTHATVAAALVGHLLELPVPEAAVVADLPAGGWLRVARRAPGGRWAVTADA